MRSILARVAVAILLSTFAIVRPAAADLPGIASSEMQRALNDWLSGAEEEAITNLSQLARNGNAAAMLMLALIDKTPALQGPWLSYKPRDRRIELMRAEGGLSGQSWIHAAAEVLPLAGLWRALWQVDAEPGLALEFARAGEPRAAREALIALHSRERAGLTELAQDPAYPQSLLALAWLEEGGRTNSAFDPATRLEELPPGDPQRILLGHPPTRADLAEWLLEAGPAMPVSALCAARCGDSRAECALAAFDALGSPLVLWSFGSPSEALIPTVDFVASPAGQGALLRRILLNADVRGRRHMVLRAKDTDACFGALLEQETERYRPTRPPQP